MVEQASTPPF